MSNSLRTIIVALLTLILLTACSSTKVKYTWKADQPGETVRHILVLGVGKSDSSRKFFEAELSRQLKQAGVMATPSFNVLPGSDELTEEAVVKAATEHKIDAVLVAVVLGVRQSTKSTTMIMASPSYYGGYGGGWYGNYHGGYATAHTYQSDFHVANIETSLYRLDGEDKIWSALAETVNMDTGTDNIPDLSKALVSSLKKDGMI